MKRNLIEIVVIIAVCIAVIIGITITASNDLRNYGKYQCIVIDKEGTEIIETVSFDSYNKATLTLESDECVSSISFKISGTVFRENGFIMDAKDKCYEYKSGVTFMGYMVISADKETVTFYPNSGEVHVFEKVEG